MLPAAATATEQAETVPHSTETAPAWSLTTRLFFRFGVIYFALYVLTTQMLSSLVLLPSGELPQIAATKRAIAIFSWVAGHVMGITSGFVTGETGSGDRTLDWAQTIALVAVAVLGTIVWSLATRRRAHPTVQKWFAVFLRFALGATMLTYGFAKVFPLQMPPPSLQRLLEPYGSFSPMGVLWYSVGASPAYEVFVGSAEALGGVLLMIPPLATLGALITLADVTEIFVLNMTYDVPVKLFSFQLILMSLFLLAPEMRRLASVIIMNRPTGPSPQRPLFRGRTATRVAVTVQLVCALYIVSLNVYGGWDALRSRRAATSPLYGIWDVTDLSNDGQPRPPLLTDASRWRRVIFPPQATAMSVQLMNDTFAGFICAIDTGAKTVKLEKGADRNWKATFAYDRPDADTMSIDGTMDGHRVQAKLHRADHTKFMLLSRGFHWIQEAPFNR